MEFVRSKDGTHIAFQQCGEGPPLVLVHGASGSHKRWGGVLPELSAEFTVCAIDRRGRGESGDADCYAIEREYEDVAAVVDAMDEPVNLLGHSFGAICTLEASLLTGNIARLVLCEPPVNAPELPAELSARMQGMLDSGDREGVLSTFLSEYAGIPEHELEKMRRSPAWPARIAAAHTLLRESVAVDDISLRAGTILEC
ncbi:MAG: alpha/beta fold hydrolase [Thermomicrobiales bacterium]